MDVILFKANIKTSVLRNISPDALEWAGEYSAAKSYTKVNKWGVEIGCFEAVYRDLL